jgi:alkanesulfonate monooxygenase SsuD/methylene tetrahydromethanopterin reductase-like flavin-dependent oxidoreductase (luciferase family)
MRFDILDLLWNPRRAQRWSTLADESREFAGLADALGFDGIWYGEHHFDVEGTDQCPNPIVLATDLAGRTRRIRIGLAAISLPLWHPMRLAEDLAMLDQLSGGRLDVAFSRGILRGEIVNLNPEADREDEAKSRAIFSENLEIVKRAWTADPFSWEGERYRIPWPGTTWPGKAMEPYHDENGELAGVAVIPQPLQQPMPPLYAVSEHRPGFVAAARQGLGIITAFPTGKVLAGLRRAYFEEAERAGMPAAQRRSVVCKALCVAETDEEARRLAAPAARESFNIIKRVRGIQAWLDEDDDPDDPRLHAMDPFDLMLERDHLMVGSPESVAERLIRLARTQGIDHWILGMGRIRGADRERSVRLFAEEVAPAVRRAAGQTPVPTP